MVSCEAMRVPAACCLLFLLLWSCADSNEEGAAAPVVEEPPSHFAGIDTGPIVVVGAADVEAAPSADAALPDSGSESPPLVADAGAAGSPGDTKPSSPPPPSPPGGVTAASCFVDQMNDGPLLVDYDQFGPAVAPHCKGTQHQKITGVQRVVFAGDSITVGTPPTEATLWYRNVMAHKLAAKFGLEPPGWIWENVDIFGGKVLEQDSGDFSSCAKWGARTDDLTLEPHQQLITCNPPELREKTTLVIITAGGNDLFAWAKDLAEGKSIDELWAKAEQAVADFETSIHWMVDDPATFPNGVFVVFANTYEFSDVDSGNDLATCPGADIIAMNTALVDPDFSAMAGWMMEEYMRIAVETGTDMVFLGEHFCGRGYMYDQPGGRCYRGGDASLWLDFTCMHPGGAGHAGIVDLFMSVIED